MRCPPVRHTALVEAPTRPSGGLGTRTPAAPRERGVLVVSCLSASARSYLSGVRSARTLAASCSLGGCVPARIAQVTNHSCRHSSGMGRQNTCYSVVGMTTNRLCTQEEAGRHFELCSTWGCAQSIYVNARRASESKDSVANFPRRKTEWGGGVDRYRRRRRRAS